MILSQACFQKRTVSTIHHYLHQAFQKKKPEVVSWRSLAVRSRPKNSSPATQEGSGPLMETVAEMWDSERNDGYVIEGTEMSKGHANERHEADSYHDQPKQRRTPLRVRITYTTDYSDHDHKDANCPREIPVPTRAASLCSKSHKAPSPTSDKYYQKKA